MTEIIRKICTRCYRLKPRSEFHRQTKTYDGLAGWCKSCCSIQAKERRSKQQRASFKYRIEREYDLTYKQYEKMLRDQNGRCAICERAYSKGRDGRLHIDHDHASGVVRGLLCASCNWGLGQFEEDTERLKSAIRYLEQHGT